MKDDFRDLYVYGYDVPEAYAIEKDAKMYYAFFASKEGGSFAGEVELRGLKAGAYRVVDYVDGKDLGTVQAEAGKAPRLKCEFTDHLLLEVSAK